MNALPFSKSEIETSLAARFRFVVAQCAERPALIANDMQMTYRELDAASDAVAHAILQMKDDAPILACLFESGPQLLITLLGLFKSGKGFVAPHLDNPRARLQDIVAISGARLIVTTNAHAPLAADLLADAGNVLIYETIPANPNPLPPLDIAPETIAMLSFSSGTTGKPKGVPITHRNMLHRVWSNLDSYNVKPHDRLASLGFPGYIGPMRQLVNTWLNGAALALIQSKNVSSREIISQLRALGVTQLHTNTAFFRTLMPVIESAEDVPHLQLAVIGGQAVLPADVRAFREKFGTRCTLGHRFSASECGQVTQLLIPPELEFPNGIVPVGYAEPDKEILILDENRQPVPQGEVGEFAVRSQYLADGYWRDPERSARTFLPDPTDATKKIFLTRDLGRLRADGMFEHLGRKDHRVRVRGLTVELAAVEAALRALPEVRDVVVIDQALRADEGQLIAYVEPRDTPPLQGGAVRAALRTVLPEFMIPARVIVLEEIPRLPNHKIDYRALPAPDTTRPEMEASYTAPRTPYEARICAIWSQVLGIEPIGVEDTFFDLGGDSLLATQIVARVQQEFQIHMPLQELFRAPTPAAMARTVVEYQLNLLSDQERTALVAKAKNIE